MEVDRHLTERSSVSKFLIIKTHHKLENLCVCVCVYVLQILDQGGFVSILKFEYFFVF